MDVLSCRIVNISGRRYRVQGSGWSENVEPIQAQEEDEWEECKQLDDSLISQEKDAYVTKISADKEVYGYVIGKHGDVKNKIESETKTTIIVPRHGSEGAPEITIKGASAVDVGKARSQVELIITENVDKWLDYNFFVSIPLCTPAILQRFKEFQERVLHEDNLHMTGIHSTIFQKPEHLHLTGVMLKLYSKEKRTLAHETMANLSQTLGGIIQEQPLQVRLKGLDHMNDNPSAMHVLYAQIKDKDGQSRLQTICDEVVNHFSEAGLLQARDETRVKMHVTLMNSRFRKSSGGNAKRAKRMAFDGRMLMKDPYKGFDFGQTTISEIHLSQRRKYDPKTGYYHCAKKLEI